MASASRTRQVLNHVECGDCVICVRRALKEVQRIALVYGRAANVRQHFRVVIDTNDAVPRLRRRLQKLPAPASHVQEIAAFRKVLQVPSARPAHGFRRESPLCVPVGPHASSNLSMCRAEG